MNAKYFLFVTVSMSICLLSCNSDIETPQPEAEEIPRIEDASIGQPVSIDVASLSSVHKKSWQLFVDDDIDFDEISDEEIAEGALTARYFFCNNYLTYDEISQKMVSTDGIYDISHGNIIFSDTDIQSLNLTTREIAFATDSATKKMRDLCYTGRLSLFFNDKLLFANIKTLSLFHSYIFFTPCIIIDSQSSKFHLIDMYPAVISETWPDKDEWRIRRDTNAKRIKSQWTFLFRYLEIHNKLIQGGDLPWWLSGQ